MKNTRRIEIEFDENGDPTVDALGFSGASCKQATAPFERAMGGNKTVLDKPELKHRARSQTHRAKAGS